MLLITIFNTDIWVPKTMKIYGQNMLCNIFFHDPRPCRFQRTTSHLLGLLHLWKFFHPFNQSRLWNGRCWTLSGVYSPQKKPFYFQNTHRKIPRAWSSLCPLQFTVFWDLMIISGWFMSHLPDSTQTLDFLSPELGFPSCGAAALGLLFTFSLCAAPISDNTKCFFFVLKLDKHRLWNIW